MFKLQDLANIDGQLQQEHKDWLKANGFKINDPNFNFSIQDFPELWSGAVVNEKEIEAQGEITRQEYLKKKQQLKINDLEDYLNNLRGVQQDIRSKSLAAEIERIENKIKDLKEQGKLEDIKYKSPFIYYTAILKQDLEAASSPTEKAKISAKLTSYENFFHALKERFLLQAIQKSLSKIYSDENDPKIAEFLKYYCSAIELQTKPACLERYNSLHGFIADFDKDVDKDVDKEVTAEIEKIFDDTIATGLVNSHNHKQADNSNNKSFSDILANFENEGDNKNEIDKIFAAHTKHYIERIPNYKNTPVIVDIPRIKEIIANGQKKKQEQKDNQARQQSIQQLHILTKRWLDIRFDKAKKLTTVEAVVKAFSGSTAFIGIGAGVAAAAFGIKGIFFPPALIPAGILGYISFVAYGSTATEIYTMVNNARHHRSPSVTEAWSLAKDLLFLPLNAVGVQIFSAYITLANNIHISNHLHHAFYNIINWFSYVFNNIVSNFQSAEDIPAVVVGDIQPLVSPGINIVNLTDAIPQTYFHKEGERVAKQQIDADATIKYESVAISVINRIKLKPTTSAGSFKNIRSDMLFFKSAENAIKEVSTVKQKLLPAQNQLDNSARSGRGFAYVKMPTNQDEELTLTTKSYHAHILTWDSGFFGFGKTDLAKAIYQATDKYEALKVNATYQQRLLALYEIKSACALYLAEYEEVKQSKTRYCYVENLKSNVDTELTNLSNAINNSNISDVEIISSGPTLVGFKAK